MNLTAVHPKRKNVPLQMQKTTISWRICFTERGWKRRVLVAFCSQWRCAGGCHATLGAHDWPWTTCDGNSCAVYGRTHNGDNQEEQTERSTNQTFYAFSAANAQKQISAGGFFNTWKFYALLKRFCLLIWTKLTFVWNRFCIFTVKTFSDAEKSILHFFSFNFLIRLIRL